MGCAAETAQRFAPVDELTSRRRRRLELSTAPEWRASLAGSKFMANNRSFERPEFTPRSLNAALTNVTTTARQWHAVFGLYVHQEILGKYTAPTVGDDVEGYLLVGALVQEVDAALEGRLSSRLVSYGSFLGIEFAFLAQRRWDSTDEVLNLRVVLGPCDSDHLVAWVFLLKPAV